MLLYMFGLTKSYGSVRAVAGIGFDVAPGECVAILGPNGAGKTTTTEILAGFRDRDSGEVRVLGVDPESSSRQWRNRIGVVLQSAADLKELTVREAVTHFAKYYPKPSSPDEVIAAVGLTEKHSTRISQLSGGQRRRLDVAIGIIGDPELLFLDEPTTGFDPAARRQFWSLVENLKSRGVTILLTTHYLEEAEQLADRVVIIAKGNVVADRTPSSLRADAIKNARVSWLEDGVPKEIVTAEPTRLLRELSLRFDAEIPELTVGRPSLEEVYLHLVEEVEQS